MNPRKWVATLCLVFAPPAAVAQEAPPVTVGRVVVFGREDTPAKLDHILPEVAGTRITVTKRTSVTKLDEIPTVVDNNERELFARTPGVQVSEQGTPGQFNLSYRGLGNPQESEYVLVLQDGVPIATDWIGFPTLYYFPLPQSLSRVELIRGGSSLIYGPEPAPAINLVSRRPKPGQPLAGSSEQIGGSNGLYSTFNVVEGTSGSVEFRADAGYARGDGGRANAASRLAQGDAYLGYRPDARQLWYLAVHLYDVSSGNPGRIGYDQSLADPTFSPTPFNHDWVSRYAVTLGNELDLGRHWRIETKAWAAYQDLSNRATGPQSPGRPPPATTVLQAELFRSEGLDIRAVDRWGRGNALTLGGVIYHDDAPFRQWTSPDLTATPDRFGGTPRLDQARTSNYESLFAESLFRLPHRFHLVASARLEHETLSVVETVRPPFLTRPLADVQVGRTVPLFALGAGNDFGKDNETYFSVSQGYRPLRFFDVASPFANLQPGNLADPARSVSWEAGVHGTPAAGLFYDVGLFWIEFRNRIETIVVSPTDTVNRNSGDTRHRGFEGEVSWDFLAGDPRGRHLTAFANLSLLDARFTASRISGQVGKRPAYAPEAIGKYGLTFRKDGVYSISVTGQSVSSQYFQDSDQPAIAPAFVPARIPPWTVVDVAGDYRLTRSVRLTAGVSNLSGARYYSRVFQNGIEPAPGRTVYGGLAVGF
ncbi:MAG: TonB-dependent receptor [Caulobacteraceae bacterium]